MANWTFITNHGAVLVLIAQHSQITAREIANKLSITERSVHRMISDLDMGGFIEKSRGGRVNRYRINRHLPLRRSEIRETNIGDLLNLLIKDETNQ